MVKTLVETLLVGDVSACKVGAVAILGTTLPTDYPAGFSSELDEEHTDEAVKPAREWLELCAPFAGGPPRSGEHLFFSLVLVDETFAREFRRTKPAGGGFEALCRDFAALLDPEERERWERTVSASPTPADCNQLPAMASAIDRREAEFSQLAEARCFQEEKFLRLARPARSHAAKTSPKAYERFYLPVLDAFEHKHGEIVEQCWCGEIPAGVVRTNQGDRLYFDGYYPEKGETVIDRCKDLRQRAKELLTEKEYTYVVFELYNLLTQWYSVLDEAARSARGASARIRLGGKGGTVVTVRDIEEKIETSSIEWYEERVSDIGQRLERRIVQRSRRWYVAGTLTGLLGLGLIFGFLAALDLGNGQRLYEGAVFGATGALASVLLRMKRDDFEVDTSQGTGMVLVVAMVRPLAGALFGAIVCAAALSGILPLELPSSDPDRFYFLGVLAFIAGFSERLAPNLLDTTADRIAPGASAG